LSPDGEKECERVRENTKRGSLRSAIPEHIPGGSFQDIKAVGPDCIVSTHGTGFQAITAFSQALLNTTTLSKKSEFNSFRGFHVLPKLGTFSESE
jgi:hypothetical protein